jgi:hypothetical protein
MYDVRLAGTEEPPYTSPAHPFTRSPAHLIRPQLAHLLACRLEFVERADCLNAPILEHNDLVGAAKRGAAV